jgi:hypothetical protein
MDLRTTKAIRKEICRANKVKLGSAMHLIFGARHAQRPAFPMLANHN